MIKKIFICCHPLEREQLLDKIKMAYQDNISLTESICVADIIFLTSAASEKDKMEILNYAKNHNIPINRIDKNLMNHAVYEKILMG